MECRICFEQGGMFVKPCKCKGDTNVHEHCLRKWIEISKRENCEICKTTYRQREIFAWQFDKYCKGCRNCKLSKADLSVTFASFALSFFILITIDLNDILLMSSIVCSGMYILFLLFSLKKFQMFHLDTLFWLKLSYSIPLWIVLFILFLQGLNDCSINCFTVLKECVPSCIHYQKKELIDHLIIKNLLFDLVNILFIVLCRSCIICPHYHKKTVFDEYESEPLLA